MYVDIIKKIPCIFKDVYPVTVLYFQTEVVTYWGALNIPPILTEIHKNMSPWHIVSSGCRWRRRPPDMDGSCEYTE
jgi:hypothetical protein